MASKTRRTTARQPRPRLSPPLPPTGRLLSLPDAARELAVSVCTLDRYLRDGKVPCVRLFGGHRKIDRQDIDRVIADRKEAARR